ncbi:dihydroxyacetone kinase DhaL subunit [Isoptericola jiangsuensis]|uniref:Dihydroxyacetone kinase DhaL subunit n=1 Tax=Isoptericola jiangsuensis TaxID=548579 RepID=A0A2A9EUM9_9MICO|nr:dihydroxyacetone kinase subunit DhaL [Isoptericola jiangsuensis]PFG42734.1 dihydroxyacetone kinase DhaL subunit [Isoptericola jiangsuensis]
MVTALDVEWAVRWVRCAAADVRAHRDELTELDRLIGDGDHGVNMDRGFTAVVARLDGPDGAALETVGQVLQLVATTLMSTVGGAAGPLYGTAFLHASRVTARPVLDAAGVLALVEAAAEGIASRGHAVPGNKTMVDAWHPAVEAAGEVVDGGDALVVLRAAADAAGAGALATIPMTATKGRASYLGERSAGTQDPGACSTALVLAAAVTAAEQAGAS